MSNAPHQIQQTPEPLLAELQEAGAKIKNRNSITCPFHDDKNPSASIYEKDGIWRFKCHSCDVIGDVFDIRARRTGKTLNDVLKEHQQTNGGNAVPKRQEKLWKSPTDIYNWLTTKVNKVVAYKYKNPENPKQLDLVVFRCEPGLSGGRKGFIQVSPRPGGWTMKRPQGALPLYARERFKDRQRVVVVEGEKTAEALWAVNIAATTSAMGAKKAHEADWTPLVGKDLYLWPDNDEPGREHMDNVQSILTKLDCRIFKVEPSYYGLEEKEDAYDFIRGMKLEGVDKKTIGKAVRSNLLDSTRVGASDALVDHFEKIIAGEWKSLDLPWDRLSRSSRALMPGTVTIICGDPGDGKSFAVLQALEKLHTDGHKVSIYELEEDLKFWQHRVLAQLAKDSNLTDDRWIYQNPDEARMQIVTHRDWLDDFSRRIYVAPDEAVKLPKIAAWIEQRAKAGDEVIAVDPVTAADAGNQRFVDDLQFVILVKAIARKYQTRVILVTHPRKGGSNKRSSFRSLDDVAGGSAYPRFAQTVLWILKHDQPKEVTLKRKVHSLMGDIYEDFDESINRTITNMKARNGPGAGASYGFRFNTQTLLFEELGLIKEKGKKK